MVALAVQANMDSDALQARLRCMVQRPVRVTVMAGWAL